MSDDWLKDAISAGGEGSSWVTRHGNITAEVGKQETVKIASSGT